MKAEDILRFVFGATATVLFWVIVLLHLPLSILAVAVVLSAGILIWG